MKNGSMFHDLLNFKKVQESGQAMTAAGDMFGTMEVTRETAGWRIRGNGIISPMDI